MTFGEQLKMIRKMYSKTLTEIEETTGISNQNLSRWENDKAIPNIIFCIKLADYYNISLDELVGRDF